MSSVSGGYGTLSHSVRFDSLTKMANSQTNYLDQARVLGFEFDADNPKGYGFAVHSVTLY